MNDTKQFVPLNDKLDTTKEVNSSQQSLVENLNITKLQLELKLHEANIKSVEDIITVRERLQVESQTLAEEQAMSTAERALLDSLENDYKTLLASMNEIIKHQEQVTNEANEKLSLATAKMENYNALQEKKCNECLARDKKKCDKCYFKLYAEKYNKDFEKFKKKLI
jgi:hypothetical protein